MKQSRVTDTRNSKFDTFFIYFVSTWNFEDPCIFITFFLNFVLPYKQNDQFILIPKVFKNLWVVQNKFFKHVVVYV